jgi:hypothetical protein
MITYRFLRAEDCLWANTGDMQGQQGVARWWAAVPTLQRPSLPLRTSPRAGLWRQLGHSSTDVAGVPSSPTSQMSKLKALLGVTELVYSRARV